MIFVIWILGIIIIALMLKLLLQRASITGKPMMLLLAVAVVLLAAIALALNGLWPVATSLLGGLAVYGRPILRAFGVWQTVRRFTKPKNSTGTKRPVQNQTTMDKDQARKILDVGQDATEEEIILAHKRLMAKNHPDKGGSTFLASQINQAKDVLLG